jgi:hypothetical protein
MKELSGLALVIEMYTLYNKIRPYMEHPKLYSPGERVNNYK